jgi:hypothetical protein
MSTAKWGLLVLLMLPAGIASGRLQGAQQEDSLAAAARRAREKKKVQPNAAKVWDNENIPKDPGDVSVVGQEASPAAETTANQGQPAPGATDKNPASDADKLRALNVDLAAAKENLTTLQNDLDILQRKFTLDQQTYYAKPDYSSDKEGAANLKDEQGQIDSKQQEISDAQKKIQDLQSKIATPAGDNTIPTPQ